MRKDRDSDGLYNRRGREGKTATIGTERGGGQGGEFKGSRDETKGSMNECIYREVEGELRKVRCHNQDSYIIHPKNDQFIPWSLVLYGMGKYKLSIKCESLTEPPKLFPSMHDLQHETCFG